MNFLKFVTFWCLIGGVSKQLHAFVLEDVVFLNKSLSEKSVVIDRGLLDHYNDGLTARFFVQTGEADLPKIFLFAEGILIKSLPRKSYWLLNKVHIPHIVYDGGHFLILSSKDIKEGRSLKTVEQHVVIPVEQYDSSDKFLNDNMLSVPDRLIQDSISYDKTNELYETKNNQKNDAEIKTFENYKIKSGTRFSEEYNDITQEKFYVGNKAVEIGDLKKNEDKKLLDSLAKGIVDKINSQKYGLTNGLYKNQKKTEGFRELNNQIVMNSVYETTHQEIKINETISPRLLAKIERDKEAWSEDMDDETLRRYFISTGLELEERRRKLVINELDGNELMIHYSGSMLDHTTQEDQSYRSRGYSLGIGYDLHLSRISPDTKSWSIQLLLELGLSNYNVGAQNARGEENSLGIYTNYYFYNNPLTLNSFIWMAGVGLKSGTIQMSSIALSKSYIYQTYSLPAMQLMTKYRFRSGDLAEDTVNVGTSFNAGIMLDKKHLSVNNALEDNILGSISINDLKYIFGMSFYF